MPKWRFLLLGLFLCVFLAVPSSPALAACADDSRDPLGVGCGEESGLGNLDVRITVARIIQVALSLLGIIALVLILYSGYMWMTSAGNGEKVETAKKTLYGAVIGLAIIMSAYAIASFVIRELYNATIINRTFGQP